MSKDPKKNRHECRCNYYKVKAKTNKVKSKMLAEIRNNKSERISILWSGSRIVKRRNFYSQIGAIHFDSLTLFKIP